MKPTSAVWIASASSVACTCGAIKSRVDSFSTGRRYTGPWPKPKLPAERAADGAGRVVARRHVQEVRPWTREDRAHERAAHVRAAARHARGGVWSAKRDDRLPRRDELDPRGGRGQLDP